MNMKFKTLHILGNWNMHLYTQFSFLSIIECEKHWERIRNQETGECFFSDWCLNLSVIFIKENLSHKIKKKQNNETEILENEKRGTERDWHVHAIKNCLTICEEFVHGYSYYTIIILLRIPASGHWRDWVLLLFLLLLRKIKQVTDLIPVALTAKRIGVLVLPLGWVANPS